MDSPDCLLYFWAYRFFFLVFLFLHFLVVGSVGYIKLTHVGFRAHVKIASRIVSYRIVTWIHASLRLWRFSPVIWRLGSCLLVPERIHGSDLMYSFRHTFAACVQAILRRRATIARAWAERRRPIWTGWDCSSSGRGTTPGGRRARSTSSGTCWATRSSDSAPSATADSDCGRGPSSSSERSRAMSDRARTTNTGDRRNGRG